MWTTFDPTNENTVQYGEHGADFTNTANGNIVGRSYFKGHKFH